MTHGSISQWDTLPTTTYQLTIGVGSFDVGAGGNLINLYDGQTALVEVRAVAHRSGGSGGGAIISVACFSQDGGTVTQVGPAQDLFYAMDADLAGSSLSWVISGATVVARVRSASANTYYWHCSVRTEQISEVA